MKSTWPSTEKRLFSIWAYQPRVTVNGQPRSAAVRSTAGSFALLSALASEDAAGCWLAGSDPHPASRIAPHKIATPRIDFPFAISGPDPALAREDQAEQ